MKEGVVRLKRITRFPIKYGTYRFTCPWKEDHKVCYKSRQDEKVWQISDLCRAHKYVCGASGWVTEMLAVIALYALSNLTPIGVWYPSCLSLDGSQTWKLSTFAGIQVERAPNSGVHGCPQRKAKRPKNWIKAMEQGCVRPHGPENLHLIKRHEQIGLNGCKWR